MPHKIIKELRLTEISAVRRPAQEGALFAITKSAEGETEKRVWLTTSVEGHQHLIEDVDYEGRPRDGGTTSWATTEGEETGHSHPWVRNPDGSITVGEDAGHTHGVESPAQFFKAGTTPAPSKEKGHMTAEEIAKAAQAAAETRATAAEKARDRFERIARLSDAEKALFNTMDATGQDSFLAKSDTARKADVAAAAEAAEKADPVVYTSTDAEATKYRKSDDPRLVSMAKERDENRATAKAAAEAIEKAEVEKAIADNIQNLTGDATAKADLMRAVRAIPAEKRDAALAILKAGNSAAVEFAKVRGSKGQPASVPAGQDTVKGAGALAALEKGAGEHAKANPTMTKEAAYTAFLSTAEGSKLYAEAEAEKKAG